MYMNFDSFSHGQIQSKVWLCKELETFIPDNARVAILGSWHNVLAFMLLTRDDGRYKEIVGIDLDKKVQKVADKITDAWRIGKDAKVNNIVADAGKFKTLTAGQTIQFVIGANKNGPQAEQVIVIDEAMEE